MPSNRWDEAEASKCRTPLDLRVYTSRLLGADPSLVLHGGGNTSVKDLAHNVWGEKEEALYIKGSGWDLASIEAPGFPAVRMEGLKRLRSLSTLSDPQMVNELRRNLYDSQAPDPSVEALLHAFLPHRFVDHTHADAVLAVTNQPDGKGLIEELYGKKVGVVPYVMPGFQLAKLCAEVFEADPNVEGLILLNHGVFSFGESAKESYDRMIAIVQRAEDYLQSKSKSKKIFSAASLNGDALFWMQQIRKSLVSRGFQAVLHLDASELSGRFLNHPEIQRISQQGPLTPDHVIRTKRLPLYLSASSVSAKEDKALEAALENYRENYQAYFKEGSNERKIDPQMLDPFPRVFLLPGIGVIHAAHNAKAAAISQEIYSHTMQTILDAEALGKYVALEPIHIFDVEYWVLEQAKLKRGKSAPTLQGKTALISGGARGIGKEIGRQLLSLGGCVLLIDKDRAELEKSVSDLKSSCTSGNQVSGMVADLRDRSEVQKAVDQIIRSWGGLDILVSNAGIFPPTFDLENLPDEIWKSSLEINLSGAYHLIACALPWMKAQGSGGDIVFIASKNVPAPGKGASAYSVSKAGLAQLARVCALEAGPFGIRVNTLHPHLIMDTDVWKGDIVEQRARAYQMTAEQYRRNNLLKTELNSKDVAKAVCALVGGAFAKTTGAQICVDGGHERTI